METTPQSLKTIPQTPLNSRIRQIGEEIFAQMEADPGSIFNKDWWYGRIMEWSMKNEHFKTQMFRFVDVLPSLTSGADVARHLKEYFAETEDQLPSVFNFGLGLSSLAPGLLAGAVKKNVEQMAKMFITGQDVAEALPVLKKSRQAKLGFTVDLLGEATLSEREALEYQQQYFKIIERLAAEATTWPGVDQIDTDAVGAVPRVNVSVKVTSLYSQVDTLAWHKSLAVLKERIAPIFRLAMSKGVFINLDMEQYAYKDLTLQLFEDLLSDPEFSQYPHFGTVIQAYLKDSMKDIDRLIAFARRRKTAFTVRLVKGAYWDYETIHAEQMGWPVPVFTDKFETDANYERCTKHMLENFPSIRLAVGSHNVRSVAAAIAHAESLRLPARAFEIQMLYGMADPIKRSLVKQGFLVREYATVGELIPGMAYLVRRLLENTSNQSFLRSKFADNIPTEILLRDPVELIQKTPSTPTQTPTKPSDTHFHNEPVLDFGLETHRREAASAMDHVQRSLGQRLPIVIGKRDIKATEFLARTNPSRPGQIITHVGLATLEHADQALSEAKQALPGWRKTPVEQRAQKLDDLANLILKNRMRLAAIEVCEVGKPWREADADITEAIDFCRYYAREMRRLGSPMRAGHAPGELSQSHYVPKGVAVVIAPWNFPLAILTGMVGAALVTGNTVVMKPAEQSSWIAYEMFKLAREAGFPPGVLSYLPGRGEDVGAYLVKDPRTDLVAFTGSRTVGLNILEVAGHTQIQQRGVKKCIVEMGGKNAVIIDTDADLDEAVEGVISSAFGYQGQKCSAASRVIVLNAVYDRFVERLVEATRSLVIGPADDMTSFLGPVVDEEAYRRILAVIETHARSTPILFQGSTQGEGYFVPPTIFGPVDPQSSLAQEEIFGPVLAVLRAADLGEAIQIANSTIYGLTGGLYSRSPANIERVKEDLDVGNLYINRGITGALVERHPFGGVKMSGVGSKTGGRDYLLQFMDPRVMTENTLRRGFAPND
jgi:RHH-type proline utilization regulon transcriptional repressor/proline dehydrogenase/delta 1-pyrroline-5-carboxylate dehydrogenase